MSLWKTAPSLDDLNKSSRGTLSEHMGIVFTEVGPDYLVATMPVRDTNKQPYGLLHGGASCVLAETIGSVASNLCVDNSKDYVVGQVIEANHLRPATDGHVKAHVKPIHIGRTSHLWEILITDDNNKLVCHSKLTTRVVSRVAV